MSVEASSLLARGRSFDLTATWARPRNAVGLAALVAGIVALVLRTQLFPHGSANNDEGVYLLQAHALVHGHLTLPFAGDPRAHQPWLFAIGDDGYVAKYLPIVAAIYAIGLMLFHSVTPVLIFLAAVLPVLMYRLGRLTGLSEERATVAAVLFSLSPAILVEGGLVLSYLPFLVLLLCCWISVFSAVDGSVRWAFAAGLAAACAAAVRPMDGVLMIGPALLWLVWRKRASLSWLLAGGLPVGALMLAFNAVVTGSPLRLPFSLFDPLDKVGFGERRLYPEAAPAYFGPVQSWDGTRRHFFIEPAQWFLGFLVVLPLALWSVRRGGPATERHRVLAAGTGVVMLGYLVFWGPWLASVLWGGPRTIGPFYSLAPILPLVLCAFAVPLRPRVLVPLVAIASVHPVVHGADALDRARRERAATAVQLSLLDPQATTLLDIDPPYTGHPVSGLAGPGVILAAHAMPSTLPAGPRRYLALAASPYRPQGAAWVLREPIVSRGSSLRLRVRRVGAPEGEVLVVSRNGRTFACRQGGGVTLTLTATGVSGCSGAGIPDRWFRASSRACPDLTCLTLSTWSPGGHGWLPGAWRRMPVETSGASVTVLTDGPVLRWQGRGWLEVVAERQPGPGLHSRRPSANHGTSTRPMRVTAPQVGR